LPLNAYTRFLQEAGEHNEKDNRDDLVPVAGRHGCLDVLQQRLTLHHSDY